MTNETENGNSGKGKKGDDLSSRLDGANPGRTQVIEGAAAEGEGALKVAHDDFETLRAEATDLKDENRVMQSELAELRAQLGGEAKTVYDSNKQLRAETRAQKVRIDEQQLTIDRYIAPVEETIGHTTGRHAENTYTKFLAVLESGRKLAGREPGKALRNEDLKVLEKMVAVVESVPVGQPGGPRDLPEYYKLVADQAQLLSDYSELKADHEATGEQIQGIKAEIATAKDKWGQDEERYKGQIAQIEEKAAGLEVQYKDSQETLQTVREEITTLGRDYEANKTTLAEKTESLRAATVANEGLQRDIQHLGHQLSTFRDALLVTKTVDRDFDPLLEEAREVKVEAKALYEDHGRK